MDARQCTLDARDIEQRIALDYAYIGGHTDIVEYLHDSVDEEKLPPVHLACQSSDVESVKLFPRESLEVRDSHG